MNLIKIFMIRRETLLQVKKIGKKNKIIKLLENNLIKKMSLQAAKKMKRRKN